MASHPLDAMTAAPEHHSVLFENDRVRVLDTRLRPGDCTPVHAHEWPAALYVLNWSDFVRCDPEDKLLSDSRTSGAPAPAPGAAMWLAPLEPHYVRNVGVGDLRIIAVEVKTP